MCGCIVEVYTEGTACLGVLGVGCGVMCMACDVPTGCAAKPILPCKLYLAASSLPYLYTMV